MSYFHWATKIQRGDWKHESGKGGTVENTGVKNVGVENVAPKFMGGKRESNWLASLNVTFFLIPYASIHISVSSFLL